MTKVCSYRRSLASRSLLLLHLTVVPIVTHAAAGLGKYDPCITAGHLSRVRTPSHHYPCAFPRARVRHDHDEVLMLKTRVQGSGFYVGVAFWPGGTIEDWGPVYNSAANYTGLSPCESTAEYNATGLTHQQYLVRARDIACAHDLLVIDSGRETLLQCCRSGKVCCSGVMKWSWIA